MADGGGITLATSDLTSGSNAPSGGNNCPPNGPGPSGQGNQMTSKNRCQRCSESHLRCSISQTGVPCDFCRRLKIPCAPAVVYPKGVKPGTKRGPYKKTKSNHAEGTSRPETTSNSADIVPAASDFARNKLLPDVQRLKRALVNLNSMLDVPSHKKTRYTEDVQHPAERFGSLTTSGTMNDSRPCSIPTLNSHNTVNRTPLPSERGQLIPSRRFSGVSTTATSATNTSNRLTEANASGYGQWSRLPTIDNDEDYDDEDEDVFYDSSPFPSTASTTATLAGDQSRSLGEDTSTTSTNRETSRLSSADIASASALAGSAVAHEVAQANNSISGAPESTHTELTAGADRNQSGGATVGHTDTSITKSCPGNYSM
ncbi:hypothetical protein N431DRAFT_448159 [Stipitochalara longipes BDJ]|nr:hypothetical protein N431DRAFT_448159 [Stipitochalara longipes BDJ]